MNNTLRTPQDTALQQTQNKALSKQARKRLTRWGLFFVTLAIVIFVNLPIITMALNSLRTTPEILSERSLIPQHPSLDQLPVCELPHAVLDLFPQ